MPLEIKAVWLMVAALGFCARRDRTPATSCWVLLGALALFTGVFSVFVYDDEVSWDLTAIYTAVSVMSFAGGYAAHLTLVKLAAWASAWTDQVLNSSTDQLRSSLQQRRTPHTQQVPAPTDNGPLNPATPARRTATRPSGVPTQLFETSCEPLPHGAIQVGRLSVAEAGHPCPFCGFKVEEAQLLWICKTCLVKHHRDCWKANWYRCTTFGCERPKKP